MKKLATKVTTEKDLYSILTKWGELSLREVHEWPSGRKEKYWVIFGKNEPGNFLAELRGPDAEELAKALIEVSRAYIFERFWRQFM